MSSICTAHATDYATNFMLVYCNLRIGHVPCNLCNLPPCEHEHDFAMAVLIFDARPITGESWVEIKGGHGGQRAWRVVKAE